MTESNSCRIFLSTHFLFFYVLPIVPEGACTESDR
jgi:hypothetical protein